MTLTDMRHLKSVKNSKIMEVNDFFEEDDAFYLVMELMNGGDVFDRILSLQRYTEKDARDLVRFLLETVNYIHSKGIAHRDLKPQNLLLKVSEQVSYCSWDDFRALLTFVDPNRMTQSKENNADIKVADFGFACRVHTPQSLVSHSYLCACCFPALHSHRMFSLSVGLNDRLLDVGHVSPTNLNGR